MAKFCDNCGTELQEGQDICLKCGKIINKKAANGSSSEVNSLALAGFIVALVSLFLNFWGIVGIVATVLSGVSLPQIKSRGQTGKGFALTGLIIGIFSILYGLYTILVLSDVLSYIVL